MTSKSLLLLVAGLFFLGACQISDFNTTSVPEIADNELSIEAQNALIADYARVLAASLTNESVRKAIKDETQKKFDGDYDVLVKDFQNVLMESDTRVQEYMVNHQVSTKADRSIDVEELVRRLQVEFPNLQVSVPVECDNWDVEKYEPLVAFTPVDFDEATCKEIEAFDSKGNSHFLSLETDPDFPVVVVSVSERVNRNGVISSYDSSCSNVDLFGLETKAANLTTPSGLILEHGSARTLELSWNDITDETCYEIYRRINGQGDYVKIATTAANYNYFLDSGLTAGYKYTYKLRAVNDSTTSGYSSTISTYASDRNDGEALRVARLYFTTSGLQAVEPWNRGAPEIRLRVVRGSEGGASAVFTSGIVEPANRGLIKDKWWYATIDTGYWYTNIIGTVLNFDWREEDGDANVTLTINGSYERKIGDGTIVAGGTLTIHNDDGDGNIGSKLVNWWDPKSTIYDVTGFKWAFN